MYYFQNNLYFKAQSLVKGNLKTPVIRKRKIEGHNNNFSDLQKTTLKKKKETFEHSGKVEVL